MGKEGLRLFVIGLAGALLLPWSGDPAWGFPGGGPGFGMLPVTDASPSCAACHAIAKPGYMRDVPATAPLNAQNQLAENRHWSALEKGVDAYKLLSPGDRETLLKQVKLVDQNTSIAITAPKEAERGKRIKVEVSAKGGIGPGSMVMLLDTDLRMQARPVQSTGWRIIGPPEVIGADGKKQTFWVDKRFKGLARDVNSVVVGGGADVEKGVYPTFKVTYTLLPPSRVGKYTLTAAFLYGTEEPNEHKVEGKWTLPTGGITGPSGRILFSDVVEVEVR